MAKEVEIAKSDDLTLFVPRFIDEYGFTPEEFRVFARIMRRASGENSQGCFETVPNMAMELGISQRSVRRALQVLRACNAISIIEREGKSHLITFRNGSQWLPKMQLISIRHRLFGTDNERDRERKMTPVGNDRPIGNDRPPLSEMTDKGYPNKGIPLTHTSDTINTRDFPFSDLIASFPNIEFTPAQLGHIATDVKDTPVDREAWASTLLFYVRNHDPALNKYMPTRVGSLLDVFKQHKDKLQRKTNGTNKPKRTDADVFAESADFYANYPDA